MRAVDIHKAGGVLLRDKQFLICRSFGKTFFIAPGGKLEAGETARSSLSRELREELNIEIDPDSLVEFGTFYADAIGHDNKYLQMDVFIVPEWKGEIVPSNEVEEVRWIDSQLPEGLELGSIFRHEVLPRLKEKGLIT